MKSWKLWYFVTAACCDNFCMCIRTACIKWRLDYTWYFIFELNENCLHVRILPEGDETQKKKNQCVAYSMIFIRTVVYHTVLQWSAVIDTVKIGKCIYSIFSSCGTTAQLQLVLFEQIRFNIFFWFFPPPPVIRWVVTHFTSFNVVHYKYSIDSDRSENHHTMMGGAR